MNGNGGYLMVQDCPCGQRGCDTFLIVLVDPCIREVVAEPGSPIEGKTGFFLHVPVEHAQGVVDEIRACCAKKGVPIR